MSEGWVRTATGWLTRAPAHGPMEAHHGPHARHFSRTGNTIEGIGSAAGFVLALLYGGGKALAENAAAPTWTSLLTAAVLFLAAGALAVLAAYRTYETHGAVVIDPVERYVELPAGLLTAAHRAALGVTPFARARIAFADITQIHRRTYRWRHREIAYLYIADRHGEADLYIPEAQVDGAAELVTGWRATG